MQEYLKILSLKKFNSQKSKGPTVWFNDISWKTFERMKLVYRGQNFIYKEFKNELQHRNTSFLHDATTGEMVPLIPCTANS